MQYTILTLFRETPQMPVTAVTLTGSERLASNLTQDKRMSAATAQATT